MVIAVDLEVDQLFAWKIVAGCLGFASRHDGVRLHLADAKLCSQDPGMRTEDCDAAILLQPNPNLPIPQVCVSTRASSDAISVTVDESMVVKLVVDQFLQLGLSHFAFAGPRRWAVARLRWQHFSTALEEHGFEPVFVEFDRENDGFLGSLEAIPKPCGLMVFNDWLGIRLLQYKENGSLRIPQEISVIAVDNLPDPMQSNSFLSSVEIPFAHLGFHAARLCCKILAGEPVTSMKIEPTGLVLRESVNAIGKTEPAVAASHFMRMNLDQPIQMEDLVSENNLSRRRLEQLFRATYGTSPMLYLKNLRVERAKYLLRNSTISLSEVSKRCGYRDVNHLCRIFRMRLQTTPLKYRRHAL